MLGLDKHKQAAQNIFMSSVQGLANVLAFAIALLLTPKVYGWSVDWVVVYVADAYGEAWSGFTRFVWGITTFLTIYFGSRATVGTLLVFGGLAIVTKFM